MSSFPSICIYSYPLSSKCIVDISSYSSRLQKNVIISSTHLKILKKFWSTLKSMEEISTNRIEKMLGISGVLYLTAISKHLQSYNDHRHFYKLSLFLLNWASLVQRTTATFPLVTNIRMKLPLCGLGANIWISKTKFTLARRERQFIEQM